MFSFELKDRASKLVIGLDYLLLGPKVSIVGLRIAVESYSSMTKCEERITSRASDDGFSSRNI